MTLPYRETLADSLPHLKNLIGALMAIEAPWDNSRQGSDLDAYIRVLPTRQDFKVYVQRPEDSYKQEIQSLRKNWARG